MCQRVRVCVRQRVIVRAHVSPHERRRSVTARSLGPRGGVTVGGEVQLLGFGHMGGRGAEEKGLAGRVPRAKSPFRRRSRRL